MNHDPKEIRAALGGIAELSTNAQLMNRIEELKAEIARLTADLQARTDDNAALSQGLEAALVSHRRMDERLAAALETLPDIVNRYTDAAIAMECADQPTRKFKERADKEWAAIENLWERSADILASVKARAKAEGRAEGLRRLIADMEEKGAQMITIAALRRIAKEEPSATV